MADIGKMVSIEISNDVLDCGRGATWTFFVLKSFKLNIPIQKYSTECRLHGPLHLHGKPHLSCTRDDLTSSATPRAAGGAFWEFAGGTSILISPGLGVAENKELTLSEWFPRCYDLIYQIRREYVLKLQKFEGKFKEI